MLIAAVLTATSTHLARNTPVPCSLLTS